MEKKFAGVLFDFNGTLLFDSDMHMEAFRQVFPLYGHDIPSDDFMIQRCFGRTNETIYKENFDPNATAEDILEFEKRKESIYHQLCLSSPERFRLVDGAPELLDYLKENKIPFCLATGSNWLNVEFYIKHLNLSRWFGMENMVYDNGTYPGKPAPDIFLLSASRMGVDPALCVGVEDSLNGVRAIHAAKMRPVMIPDMIPPTPEVEALLWRKCRDLAELQAIIAERDVKP